MLCCAAPHSAAVLRSTVRAPLSASRPSSTQTHHLVRHHLLALTVPRPPALPATSLACHLQWENLLHLDTIKARSKPLQPPKKPEAAPFFLPTVPTLAGQPTFDTDAAAAADGDTQHDIDDSDDDGGHAGSRVLRSRKGVASAAAAPSAFVALLRGSEAAGDYAGFMGHVRSLSPAGLDRELRSMTILGPPLEEDAAGGSEEQQQEVLDVAALLEALLHELDAGRNFEMVQALTARVLAVSEGVWQQQQQWQGCDRVEQGTGPVCVQQPQPRMPASGLWHSP